MRFSLGSGGSGFSAVMDETALLTSHGSCREQRKKGRFASEAGRKPSAERQRARALLFFFSTLGG